MELTILGGEELNGDSNAAASGVEERRPVTHRTPRLTDVVRAGKVAVATQVVYGAQEPALAGVGITGVCYQGNLIL